MGFGATAPGRVTIGAMLTGVGITTETREMRR